MVCSLLLNGLPALHLPLHTEMGLNARAARMLGAGLDAPADDVGKLAERLGAIMDAPARYAAAARRFAQEHADFDPEEQRRAMLDRIEEAIEPGEAAAHVLASVV